jgi:hypothetical protein
MTPLTKTFRFFRGPLGTGYAHSVNEFLRMRQPSQRSFGAKKRRDATNRRRHMRYPLRTLIQFQWKTREGLLRQGRGWTRNVSEEGALVTSTECPLVGDLVELTLRVPGKSKTGPPAFSMTMRGEVVRVVVESSGRNVCGFAIERRDAAGKKDTKQMLESLQASDPEPPRCN